ncbi:MAG TPA: T9SS type A sorting domain-containing protein, partial [Ignavibacteria bacterium]|nr:T9SS type A sorting domain-containing protein [Ignavibacteria bacterium]
KVFRSSDEGYTWINITTNGNFAGASLMNIRPDPVNGQTFYITRGSYNEGQILKTTNFGNSWIDISSDLPKIPVSDVFVDADESGVMYLGNDFGVYRTTNSGGSWQRMNNGIPFLPVTEFNLFSSGGIKLLRAATYGRGVFELNLNQPIFVNEQGLNAPAQFELLQNYPNPFNPDTKISFRLPADSKVTLTVYNLSGKEISRLVSSRNMKAGNHSVKFSAGDLSSGIYIYRLTAGDFTQSKKMILIK